MPLDWEMVKKKYGGDKEAWVPTIAGGKKLRVTGVTDEEIFVSTRINPKAPIKREGLERMVMIIETKEVKPDIASLSKEFRKFIEGYRDTASLSILNDLGCLCGFPGGGTIK